MVTKATNSVLNLVSPPIDNMVLLQGTLDNVVIGFHVPNLGRFTEVVTNEIIAISGTLDNVVIGFNVPNLGRFTEVVTNEIIAISGTLDNVVIGATVPNVAVFTNVTASAVYVSSAFTIANSQVGAVLVGSNTNPVVGITPGAAGTALISNGTGVNPSFQSIQFGVDSITGVLPVDHGGTGRASLLAHAVLLGEGTDPIVGAGPAAAGLPLVANGVSADPTFQVLGIAGGGTNFTGNRDFYVSPSGNDSTGDGSIGNPWQTLAFAGGSITNNLIVTGIINLHILPGTYSGFQQNFEISTGSWHLIGSGAGSTIIHDTSAFGTHNAISTNTSNSSIFIEGMTIASDNNSCLLASNGGSIVLADGVTLNNAGVTLNTAHFAAIQGGKIDIIRNYSVDFGAWNHWLISGGSTITVSANVSIFSTGVPGFSTFAECNVESSLIIASTVNFAFGATGSKFHVAINSAITSNGDVNRFPGDSPGFADGGLSGYYT